MTAVPVTTIRGTTLLVTSLEGLKKKIEAGFPVDALNRLDELVSAIVNAPAAFTEDDFEGPEPATRTDHQVLVSMAQLLEEILAQQKHMLAALVGSSDSRSSVEVKTSTRGVDIAAKSYHGSPVEEQVDPAVDAYFATLDKVQKRIDGTGK